MTHLLTYINPESVSLVASIAWASNIPLINIKTNGFVGMCRLQLQHHDIIESKLNVDSKFDLRVANPFPELEEFFRSFQFDYDTGTVNDEDIAHIPYVVILYHTMQLWKRRGNELPLKTKALKDQFNALVASWVPASVNINDLVNFEEATKQLNVLNCTKPCVLPDDVLDLMNKIVEAPLDPLNHTSFEILVRSLYTFISTYCDIPLSGKVPDMHASSQLFIALQQIFKNKANEDRRKFYDIVAQQLLQLQRDPNAITKDDVDVFCSNLFDLTRLVTRSLDDELTHVDSNAITEALYEPYQDAAQTPILYYICLRCVDSFRVKHNYYPGTHSLTHSLSHPSLTFLLIHSGEISERLDSDVGLLWDEIATFSSTNRLDIPALTVDHAKEMVRYGNSQLHITAAFMGGIVSQEAVKVITQQYIPINNTYIYNGICSVSATHTL
jgi:amyloid beta precursor protein binding protein 1